MHKDVHNYKALSKAASKIQEDWDLAGQTGAGLGKCSNGVFCHTSVNDYKQLLKLHGAQLCRHTL